MEALLTVTKEEAEKIRQYYNVNENQIKEDIEIIKSWKEKQPHLPENLTDDFIGKILLRNKFRVERTKRKLDSYYSLRGHNKDLIRDFENVVPSQHETCFLPLPKLTPNLERIVIVKLLKPEDYEILELIKIDLAVEEICMRYDQAVGVRYLIDFSDFTLRHLVKTNPIVFGKLMTLLEKAYSQRMLGFELINFPSFVDKILALFKLVLRPKLYERLKIHESLESVYKIVPKEFLPSDYGGTEGNIADLLKKWDKALKDHHDFFVENCKNVSLEHLRPLESKADEEFGMDGTFKKLTID